MKLRETSREIYMKAKGDYQDRVHSDQMVIVIVRREAEPAGAESNSRGASGLSPLRSDGSPDG
jgi:hypothetical protein